MRNPCADYKILFATFSYQEQRNEINQKINEILHKKQHAKMIDSQYKKIKELKHMKNNIINKSYQ